MPKTDKVIKLYDTVTIAYVDNFMQTIKDNVSLGLGKPQSLIVDIVATHAGRPTRNNGLYLPQKMRDGAQTFISPYNKPVLKHHNVHEDPLGRVIAAKYVDTSNTFTRNPTQDSAIRALCSNSTSFIQAIHLLDNLIDSPLMDDPGYPGLGHVLLTVEITDAEAIQKFLDKRYQTVSVGATTDAAVCSICKRDWVNDEEFCDHRPGQTYEGKVCRLIAGNLIYDEVSPVNVPADTLAQVVALHQNATIQNSVIVADNKPIIVAPIFRIGDALGGTNMPDPIQEPEVPPAVVDAAPQVTEEILPEKPVASEPIPESVVAPQETSQPVVDAVEDEADKHYEAMIEFGYELALHDTGFEDKKLTPEARKGLSKSTFCKPGERKYPVPDCSHARVAMAYAKKYNEASSVIACIRRKAKALGCPFEGKDCFDEKEIDMLLAAIQPQQTETIVTQDEKPVESVEQVVKQDECPTCEESLQAVKQELADITEEFNALQQSNTTQVTQLKQTLADMVVRLDMVAGTQIEDIQQATASIVCMNMDDLVKKVDGLKGSLKMDVVVAKINDGMSNIPDGTVQDPTISAQIGDPVVMKDEQLDDAKAKYARTYEVIKREHGLTDARKYLFSLRDARLVSREFDPETNKGGNA